jgi:uncharacterized OB-fold protein
MSELRDPTIEEFYKYCSERKLMAVRCIRCRQVMVPPRAICSNCRHSRVEWVELSQKGKLVTYTIVHVSPPQFKHMTPYAVGIVEMPEGVKIPIGLATSSKKPARKRLFTIHAQFLNNRFGSLFL